MGKIYQNVHKKYLMSINYTIMAIKIPIGHEIHQKFPTSGLPKCIEIDVFGMKIYNI
jgi:hypothetical protein